MFCLVTVFYANGFGMSFAHTLKQLSVILFIKSVVLRKKFRHKKEVLELPENWCKPSCLHDFDSMNESYLASSEFEARSGLSEELPLVMGFRRQPLQQQLIVKVWMNAKDR
jgi:hypothetical protein